MQEKRDDNGAPQTGFWRNNIKQPLILVPAVLNNVQYEHKMLDCIQINKQWVAKFDQDRRYT